MPTITSIGTGNWSASGTWDLSRKPASGDAVVIATGHTVTIDEAAACQSIEFTGAVVHNYDITLDDHASAFIQRNAAGSWSSNATASAPRIIQSASTSPTNRWYFKIYDVVGADTATLNFDYIEMRGNKNYLGNDTYYIHFNTGTATDPIMHTPTPCTRQPGIVEHTVLRRSTGRVYHESTGAGVVEVSGVIAFNSWNFLTLRDMISSRQRISLMTNRVHLPRCRIERYSLRPRGGGLHVEFNLSLREDI